MVNPKRNCMACIHLEYVESEYSDPSGYCCNKRNYQTEKEERGHLRLLDDPAYRNRPKRCCQKEVVIGMEAAP